MEKAAIEELKQNRENYGFSTKGSKKEGYYGIYHGIDKDTRKIVTGWVAFSWEECYHYANAVSGAIQKRFDNFDDALDFSNYNNS